MVSQRPAILGIGVDIVKSERFLRWRDYSYEQLRRVFSKQELEDCAKNSSYNFMRLAARFAAKEAFFKALSASLVKLEMTKKEFSLLFICPLVEVGKAKWDVPVLKVNWLAIEEVVGVLPEMSVDLSISHEKEFVVAQVVIF